MITEWFQFLKLACCTSETYKMPYIEELVQLPPVSHLPKAETAKMAILRLTTHFEVQTHDNPNMLSTLKLEEDFVEKKWAQLKRASELNEKSCKKAFARQFQQKLSLKAHEEQLQLTEEIKKEGIPLFCLVEDKGQLKDQTFNFYSDQIFATDTGQYYDQEGKLQFVPAYFKNKQRQGEERLAIEQAKNIGAAIQALRSKKGEALIFEGGDIRQMPGRKLFFLGQGQRTEAETAKALAALSDYYVLPIKLLLEQFYHLDCCFLPLPYDAAVIYEGEYCLNEKNEPRLDKKGWPILIEGTATMAAESRALIRKLYPPEKLVLLTKAEALAFATNAAILESIEDKRFKMFVNGSFEEGLQEEEAISLQQWSFTRAHIEEIRELTRHTMDIIEVPYRTMHGSGGSVRCTVQELACSRFALHKKEKKHFFSDRLEHLEKQQNERLKIFKAETKLAEQEPSPSRPY